MDTTEPVEEVAPQETPPVAEEPTGAEVAGGPEAPAGGEPAAPEADLEHDIQALLAERDELKGIAQRLQADFDNYRKRQAALLQDEVDRAVGKLVEALLPVLDACEAGYAHGADGVEPIWSQLIGVLQREGLEAMDPLGKPFDPSEHEAVVHEEGDVDQPVVAEVLRTGYRWRGKVLRAAMVKVKG